MGNSRRDQATDPAGEWARMRGITPRVYVCPRAKRPIAIDGRIDDEPWTGAPWTDDFTDIEGAAKPAPRFRTRARMLWDDRYFYVAADMTEPHVVATLTEKNSVIYNDNDFEIFIDPDGDNHNYYEFEVNALNTIWELTLPRPYKDGGDPKLGTKIAGLKSAVAVRGTMNDPRDEDDGWSVQVAIPWEGLKPYNPDRPTPPRTGDVWRVNFSRVEWRYDVVDGKYVRHTKERSPEDNWVWSAQGIVDMHRPERWGWVVFSDNATALTSEQSRAIWAEMAARDQLMEVYHRQRVYRAREKRFAKSLKALGIDSECLELTSTDEDDWSASVTWTDASRRVLRIRQDSLIFK
jgi:hypothetical protein